MEKLRGKTVALDFDGVLHSYESGWTGYVPTDPPVPGAVEAVWQLVNAGVEVVVFSTRADTPEGIAATKAWMVEYGFPAVEVTATKPKAVAYIDDRAVSFRGDWDDAMAQATELVDLHPRPWKPKPAVVDLGGPDGGRFWRVVTGEPADHPDAINAAVHARATGSVGATYNEVKVERVTT